MAAAAPGSSWLADLQAYESTKRREVHPLLLEKPLKGKTCREVAAAERAYDPVLQRYRDEGRETHARVVEEQERVKHLNRARDVQIRREKRDFDIVNLEGRLDVLESQEPGKRAGHGLRPGKMAIPTTYTDHNILSNIPFDEHHWAPPEQRPRAQQRQGKQRLVPVGNLKEYNIVSNRYLEHHDEKMYRDKEITLREAAQKCRRERRYDPLLQRLNDAREEANARAVEDARTVEAVLYAEAKQPLSFHGREAKGFDIIGHTARDPELLRVLDAAEEARTARFFTRHAFDHAVRENDVVMEDAREAQKCAQIAHERVLETTRRGHDIISNQPFGYGPRQKQPPAPRTMPQPELWDKVMANHITGEVPAGLGGSLEGAATLDAMRLNVPHPRHAPLGGSLTSRASMRDSATLSGASSARGPRPQPARWAPPAPAVPGTPRQSLEYSRPRR